ncbi:hypothetical protein NWQ33_04915 [Mycoplasmopsis cynos]|nr:hypothetical protein [Mycoplasmopsis cynos]
MNIETLKSWYSFYTNEGVYNRSFETFITEIKTNKSLYEKFIKMPKSTTSGIKFYGDDDYGFNQINFFTLIAIIHIFNKNYDFTKNRKIIIGFSHDSPKIQKLKDFLIRFLNRNKFQVFIHNANFVSEFLINETTKTWDIKNGIYLNYDENTNKYYLKIYYNNHEISIEEQKSFIAELLHFKSNIVLGKIKEHQTLNIDKIINFYSEKLIKDNIEKLQKITKKPSFTVYTLISDAETSYILNKILVNAGFKVHKLSQIYKNLHNLNEANFNFFKAFKINSYKADIFIFINSFNELKIYVKTKNKYVLLNEEDLIFLYINNYYLT